MNTKHFTPEDIYLLVILMLFCIFFAKFQIKSPSKSRHYNNIDVNSNSKNYLADDYTISDARVKDHIVPMSYGIEEILKLNPIYYSYNGESGTTEGQQNMGLIAQELGIIMPELVQKYTHVTFNENERGEITSTDEEEFLAIRSSEIQYVLINAIKDLNKKIENLEDRIDSFEMKTLNIIRDTKEFAYQHNIELKDLNQAYLTQNHPNPFDENCSFEAFIPLNSGVGFIHIANPNGKIIKSIKLKENGIHTVTIDASNLSSGIYTCTFILNDQMIDTKKMLKIN